MNLLDACPKVYFGSDSLTSLDKLPEGGIVLVCDPFMVESGIVRKVTDILDRNNRSYFIFSGVEPDPSIGTAAEIMQVVFREKPEVMIALGGGSAIDATKASLYFCLKYKSMLMGRHHIHKPFFVAIPTTSGTGSEVTSYTVLTDRENDVKIPLNDRSMTPDVAILCAEFTKTLPKQMVAFTGMDVLTHALEAYVCKGANSFTNMYAMEAARGTMRYLPGLFEGEGGDAAHQEMMIASTMAGLAFSNSGLGICHGIAHTIGAEFHLPHGKANSIILPYVVAFNAGLGRYTVSGREEVLSRYAQMARHLGFTQGSDREVATEMGKAIQRMNRSFGTDPSFAGNGIERQDFYDSMQVMIQKIMKDITTGANPVDVTEQDIETLLDDLYEGRDPLHS